MKTNLLTKRSIGRLILTSIVMCGILNVFAGETATCKLTFDFYDYSAELER